MTTTAQPDVDGLPLEVPSNQPIVLTDPTRTWQIQSGEAAIFGTHVVDGHPEGARRYLFTAREKSLLFAMAPPASAGDRGIIAVPLTPLGLVGISPKGLAERLSPPDPALARILQDWLAGLAEVAGSFHPRVSPLGMAGGMSGNLAPGQTIRSRDGSLVWLRIKSGTLHLLGDPELPVQAGETLLPMAADFFLEAAEPCAVEVLTQGDLKTWNSIGSGLMAFNTLYYGILAKLDDRDNSRGFERFEARIKHAATLTEKSLAELGSLLKPSGHHDLDPEAPLLAAVSAVGHYMGFVAKPPAESDDQDRPGDPVEAIARASGVRARRVKLEGHWFRHDGGALLGFLNEGELQPVALLPRQGGGYEIVNPGAKTRSRLTAEIAEHLEPDAYCLYRSLPARKLNWKDLARFAFHGRRRDLITFILVSEAGALLTMLVPQATGMVISQGIPNADHSLIFSMGIALLAASFGSAIYKLCGSVLQLRVESKADAAAQAAIWDRVLGLPAPFFRKFEAGDLSTRVQAITNIRQMLSGATIATVMTGMLAIQYLLQMLFYCPQLTLVALGLGVGMFLITYICSILKHHVPSSADIQGLLLQLVGGVTKIRTAGAEERAFATWSTQFVVRQKQQLIMNRVADALAVINEMYVPLATVLLFGVAFWSGAIYNPNALPLMQGPGMPPPPPPPPPPPGGGLNTGTFLAFNAAFGAFLMGSASLSNVIVQLLDVPRTWKMAKPILEAIPETAGNKEDPGRLKGRIEVDHLSFRYDTGPQILSDISFKAEPGESIAFVGPSGCGKSTIFRLLLGFEQPGGGRISYDGKDLSKLDVSAVRRQLGVVLQNGKLMAGSVFENIAAGALITHEEAWEAARYAGLDRDLKDMPMGLETMVSDGGANLSGGQRQRLLLSRCFVLKPRILLLDEATSALDNTTQAIVTASLDHMKVTRVIIAHRLSTIKHADRIYVLEGGFVQQVGTFAELAQQDGLFKRLMARQMA